MKLHIVPAQTGFTWVKLGIQAFRRQPLALAALMHSLPAKLHPAQVRSALSAN